MIKLTEKDTQQLAFLLSAVCHLAVFLLTWQYIPQHTDTDPHFRIPVQMKLTSQKLPERQAEDPKRVGKTKELVSKKAPAKATAKAAQKDGLVGDTTEPQLTNTVEPIYPKEALNNEWVGTVVVEVLIDKAGKPKNSRILSSTGHAVLDQSFIRTIMDYYTFEPQKKNGKAVEGKLKLTYTYKL